jgi:hypothetical protein
MNSKALVIIALLAFLVSGCGGSKIERIGLGADDVEKHAQRIEEESRSN